MKTFIKISLLSLAVMPHLGASQCAKTQQEPVQQAVPRTFQGIVIDQETILKLAKAAPQEVEKATQQWLQQSDVATVALGYEPILPTNLRGCTNATKNVLSLQGSPNRSDCNYVFQHPVLPKHLIKIAGHLNRYYNLNHLILALERNGDAWQGYVGKRDYSRALTQADYEHFAKELDAKEFDSIVQSSGKLAPVKTAPKTYQHISRVTHYLLLQEAIAQHKLAHITAPEMWLVHIPGRPLEVSDRNYVVVEQELENLQEIDYLSSKDEQELDTARVGAGLWNINRSNVKRSTDGKQLVILDLEQPNNTHPRISFHKSPARYKHNTEVGKQTCDNMKLEIIERQKNVQTAVVSSLNNLEISSIVMQYLFGPKKA